MRDIFHDIMNIASVYGVFYASSDGQVEFSSFRPQWRKAGQSLRQPDLKRLFDSLAKIHEADVSFEKCKVHLRRLESGWLAAIMAPDAQASLVRMQCEVAVVALRQQQGKQSGIGRFFKFGR